MHAYSPHSQAPSPDDDRGQARSSPPSTPASLWRTAGAGLASLGTPAGIAVLHPALGGLIAAVGVVIALTIIGTALFGSPALSERAFRLMRPLGNQPTPPGPARPPSRHRREQRRPGLLAAPTARRAGAR